MKRLKFLLIFALWLNDGEVFAHSGAEKNINNRTIFDSNMEWQRAERQYKIIFKSELVIGTEEGDSTQVLSKPVNVVVDSKGNIYVLDMTEKVIKKFDSYGKYLLTVGHPGQGPGEFMQPYAMTIDQVDNLYIADFGASRISIFRADASFVNSFIPGFYCGGLIVSPKGQLVLHGFKDGKIFHVFDINGHLVTSFGEPWEAPADPRIAAIPTFNFAFVYLGPDKYIYACPVPKPNEILKYDFGGKLLKKIMNRTASYVPLKLEEGNRAGGAIAKALVVLKDGKILVSVEMPKHEESNRGGKRTVLDLYDAQGQFLTSYEPEFAGKPRWVDQNGKIFFVTEDPFPQVVKYSLSVE